MAPTVDSPKLTTQAEVNEWRANFEADDVPVTVITNDDGTFTVRAEYPEGDVPSFNTDT